MTLGQLDHVRGDPHGCSRWLSTGDVVLGVAVTVVLHDTKTTVFDVMFDPPPPELHGYPAEHLRLTVMDAGQVFAVPVAAGGRPWLHRQPHLSVAELICLPKGTKLTWELLLGPLCLWYPRDPAHLRWRWSDGIDAYLHIVQRHLWAEEYWRRHGTWPVEDVPHGERSDGKPHPILTPALRSA